MTAKISILLPAFRAERYVDASVESVIAQTFSDWEIIAVDDASPDGTFGRLKAWAARDDRIRVWRNSANRGVTGNWNECLRKASGEFIVKLDADDVWRPRALEELIAEMGDDCVVGSGVRTLVCDGNLEPVGAFRGDFAMMEAGLDPYRNAVRPTSEWLRLAAAGHQLWAGDAFLVRRSAVDAIDGLDERFGCSSDTVFLSRILEQPGKFAHRGYAGILYRKIDGSVSDESRREGWLEREGVVLQLLTLSRLARRGPLPRALRMRYVDCWRRWKRLCENGSTAGAPDGLTRGLESAMEEVAPPPASYRAARWLRDRLGRLPL
jgi:glycosyltransferase involved in cell wall biosynthesis